MGEESHKEFLFKLSMFEQQVQQLQQQIYAVEQGIGDMQSLLNGLNELKGSVGKETLAPLGRGIFIQTKLLSEELIVDIGGRNFVKKSIQETKEIINDQLNKLGEVRDELNKRIEEVNQELTKILMDSKKNQV